MYDKNAIEVRHYNKGAKIGYLSKSFASLLAPLLDQDEVEIEGVAVDGQSTPLEWRQRPPAWLLHPY